MAGKLATGPTPEAGSRFALEPLFAVVLPGGVVLDPRVLIGISGFKESGSTRVFWRRPELSAQPSKATFVNHVFPRALARGLWLTTIAIALVFGGSAPYCLSEPPGLGSEIPILSSDPWQAI